MENSAYTDYLHAPIYLVSNCKSGNAMAIDVLLSNRVLPDRLPFCQRPHGATRTSLHLCGIDRQRKLNPKDLTLLVTRVMPYGKYKGRLIADLPGNYLHWFARQGFPEGELGRLLALMREIDHNGLSSLLTPLRQPPQLPPQLPATDG